MTVVAIDDLKLGLSPRSGREDEAYVNVLIESFPNLPPIVVHRQSMMVVDGAHRLLAAQRLRHTEIKALFLACTEAEARVEAVRRNVVHGRPLTVKEREVAARKILIEHPGWSDRRIAEICGLSPKRIAGHRSASPSAVSDSRRTGSDGKARPTDPAGIRYRVAELIAANPLASLRELARAAGTSQATVRDVQQRLARHETPLPKRLRIAGETESAASPPDVRGQRFVAASDGALQAAEQGRLFATWFDALTLENSDWEPFLGRIPLGRVYEVATEAQRRASVWTAFADALERRGRRR